MLILIALEESLVKAQRVRAVDYPHDRASLSGRAASTSSDSDSISKLQTTVRYYETKLKEQEIELGKLRKDLRYTRIVELENELSVYYQEMVRMKTASEEQGSIHSLFDKLQEYKLVAEDMLTKVRHLQERESKRKISQQKLTKERDSLKASVQDLKTQLKANAKLLTHNDELGKHIKDLQKKIKNHELDKVRMSFQYAQTNQDLTANVKHLQVQVQSLNEQAQYQQTLASAQASADQKKKEASPRRGSLHYSALPKNAKLGFTDAQKNKAKALGIAEELLGGSSKLEEADPFSRPPSQISYQLEEAEEEFEA